MTDAGDAIKRDLAYIWGKLTNVLKVAQDQDWTAPEPWMREAAKLPPTSVIAEMEHATDQQVFQISIMGQLHRLRLTLDDLEERLRRASLEDGGEVQ